MWTHEESIETTATPARIWQLFCDVTGWKRWNSGIENIEIHGPFAVGTTFSMQPPGEETLLSRLVEVEENQGFTDETVIDDTRVLVHHRIESLASGRTRITYKTEVSGPNASEFGALVVSDFPDVLRELKRLAEESG